MFERITRREEADLFVAWIAISLSFAIIKIAPYGILGPVSRVAPYDALEIVFIAFVTVGIGFILHEMAHKYAAIYYGYWAEFRKDNIMLVVAVALAALVGFVFAAPGATLIYQNSTNNSGPTRKENGIISAAGPIANLLLCIPFAVMFFITGGLTGLNDGNLIGKIGLFGIQINAMIAAFNLLPISVLDGKKVAAWNILIFIVLIATSFGLLLGSFYYL